VQEAFVKAYADAGTPQRQPTDTNPQTSTHKKAGAIIMTSRGVIPTSEWVGHIRDEDKELLGFLVPDGERFVPVTIFGYVLSGPVDRDEAEHVLESIGLSYLAERWWLRLDQTRIAVEIVEASPQRVVVKNVDFGHDGDIGERFTPAAPIDDGRLTMR
jgi:hypothetical protein